MAMAIHRSSKGLRCPVEGVFHKKENGPRRDAGRDYVNFTNTLTLPAMYAKRPRHRNAGANQYEIKNRH